MDPDIDKVIAAVRSKLPTIEVEKYQGFPGDDDGVWWFRLPGVKDFVQIDSSDGQCPFLADDSDSDPPAAQWVSDRDEVVRRIVAYFDSKQIALPNS